VYPREIDTVLANFVSKPDAIFVGGDPFLLGQRDQIVSLVAHLITSFPRLIRSASTSPPAA